MDLLAAQDLPQCVGKGAALPGPGVITAVTLDPCSWQTPGEKASWCLSTFFFGA